MVKVCGVARTENGAGTVRLPSLHVERLGYTRTRSPDERFDIILKLLESFPSVHSQIKLKE